MSMSESSSRGNQLPVAPEVFAELERLRVKTIRNGVLFAVSTLLAVAAVMFAINFGGKAWLVQIIILVLIALASLGSCTNAYNRRKRFFKQELVRAVIRELYPTLNYHPDRGISRREFQSIGLFKSRIDRYHGEDLIEGRLGETDFVMSEIKAERRETSRSGKQSHTTYVKVFGGVMLIADFHKDFQGRTVVMPDVAERLFGKLFGNFLQNLNFSEKQLIKLEDPEFERLFVVYSDDQQESRYILTPAMMARLVGLRRRLNRDIYVGFWKSRMYLGIMTDENYLEARCFRREGEEDAYHRIAGELTGLVSIIDELALNVRIWSKAGSGRVNP